MKKALFAAAMLFCLGALVHAAEPAKTTITFGKGTTVMVNGKPVESGYQLKKGDKVKVTGGKAELTTQNQVVGTQTKSLDDGATVEMGSTSRVSAKFGEVVDMKGQTGKENFYAAVSDNSLASTPPPPNPSQNQAVVPTVSPSAP